MRDLSCWRLMQNYGQCPQRCKQALARVHCRQPLRRPLERNSPLQKCERYPSAFDFQVFEFIIVTLMR